MDSLSRVAVTLEVLVTVFVALTWRSEYIARHGCVFLPHQNLKPRAGPRKVFTHSPCRVSLDHCQNSGIFERALGQVRLRAATVRSGDNKFSVLHSLNYMPNEGIGFLVLMSGNATSRDLG